MCRFDVQIIFDCVKLRAQQTMRGFGDKKEEKAARIRMLCSEETPFEHSLLLYYFCFCFLLTTMSIALHPALLSSQCEYERMLGRHKPSSSSSVDKNIE